MHSALRNPTEILAFMKEWAGRLPVVIVPTKYYQTPTDVFREAGVSTVIWANHLMRSAITAMKATAAQIYKDQCLLNVEDKVATLQEVFHLQGENELEEADEQHQLDGVFEQQPLIFDPSSRPFDSGGYSRHLKPPVQDVEKTQ
jgi:phosphoenolpyruvate phosphomutase